ncbi:MAG: hypothetical protein CFE39_00940 [Comamonadaceae bacterium PBBC2]|nr:MAG: hypothetical protein CFE39_00940 [Comamonadaceae bacterium PBBC2]
MRIVWILVAVILVLAAALFLLGQLGFLRGRAPSDLGVRDGRLKPPALTPNSVSSQADLYPSHPQQAFASIQPLKFSGDANQAMARLVALLHNTKGMVVIAQEPEYVYAQSTTALLKFTDDVEFAVDREAHVIHVRSASRIGRKDFNVNRARVETIRAQFEKN